MREIRAAIEAGRLEDYARDFYARLAPGAGPDAAGAGWPKPENPPPDP